MKLKIEDSLPEYMTPELVKNFSIKHLKTVAELQISKLAIETFWLNLHQTCVDSTAIIESIDITINAIYGNPYKDFSAFVCQQEKILAHIYANQREESSMTININLKPSVDVSNIESLKNKIKARLKIATLYHGLKLLNGTRQDNIFLNALKPILGKKIVITSGMNTNSLVNMMLPPDIGERRTSVIEKDALNREIKASEKAPTSMLSQLSPEKPRNKI